MIVLLYIISAVAFCVGLLTLLMGAGTTGAVYLLIATTALAGGAIVESIRSLVPKAP